MTWTCARQTDVRHAAASGRWTQALREHAAGCASCRDVAFVTAALSGDRTAAPRRVAPSILWAKARFARRRRAETLASQILVGSQIAIGIVGIAAVAYISVRLDGWSSLAASSWGVVFLAGAALLLAGSLATLRWVSRDTPS